MLLTQEQGFTTVGGVNVYDVVIIMQMIDKLLAGGLVSGKEISYIAALRSKFVATVKEAADFDFDNPDKPQSSKKEDANNG